MDALHSLGIDWKLLIAQIINFVVLLLILKKFLYGPLVNILEKRREKIVNSEKQIQKAKDKLAKADEKAEKVVENAYQEANQILENGKKKAQKSSDDILKTAEERAEKIKMQAEAEAERIKKEALLGAKKELGSLVSKSVEKILSGLDQKTLDKYSRIKAEDI